MGWEHFWEELFTDPPFLVGGLMMDIPIVTFCLASYLVVLLQGVLSCHAKYLCTSLRARYLREIHDLPPASLPAHLRTYTRLRLPPSTSFSLLSRKLSSTRLLRERKRVRWEGSRGK